MLNVRSLRSSAALLVPAVLFLGGCPRTCGPSTPAPEPAAAPAPTAGPAAGPAPVPAPGPASPPPAGAAFFEDFTTDQRGRFDWRLQTTNEPPQGSFLGEHDMACNAPTTHRTVNQPSLQWGTIHSNVDVSGSELVWWCAPGNDPAKGHVMTALDTGSIATLSFSPKQTFTNVTKVCWDQNMNNLGEGKWLNIFIVPAADVAAHGGDLAYAAGSGLAFGGIPLRLPPGAVDFTWLRGSTGSNKIYPDGSYHEDYAFWQSNARGMATESASRFTICVTSGQQVSIERPDGSTDVLPYNVTFPTGAVRVIFQDASYNPTKHAGSENFLTWHWDNITIQ